MQVKGGHHSVPAQYNNFVYLIELLTTLYVCSYISKDLGRVNFIES